MANKDTLGLASLAQEQSLLVKNRFGEFPERFLWHRVSDRSRQWAALIDQNSRSIGGSGNQLTGEYLAAAPKVSPDSEDKVGSYLALKGKIVGWESGARRARRELNEATEGSDKIRLKKAAEGRERIVRQYSPLRDDLRDAAAIMVQRRINMAIKADRNDDPLVVAVRDEDVTRIDELLGGGVLEGVGVDIIEGLVTNKELVNILNTLDGWMDRSGELRGPKSLPVREQLQAREEMGLRIRELYETEGVPRREVMVVEEYYAWALMDLGEVEERVLTPVRVAGENTTTATELRELAQAFREYLDRGGRGNMPMVPTMMAGGEGGDQMGMARAMEMMRGLEGGEQLGGTSRDEVFHWATKMTYELSRKPLGFAGSWWQAYMPYMEDAMITRFRALKGDRLTEAEINNGVATIRGVMMTEMQFQMILHADGAIGNVGKGGYLNYCPPPGMVPEYQWNAKYEFGTGPDAGVKKKLAEVVRDQPAVRACQQRVLDYILAGGDQAKRVVRHLRNLPSSLNEYAEELAREVFDEPTIATLERDYPGSYDEKSSKQIARLAIAHFLVEKWPEVVTWVCPIVIDEAKRGVPEGERTINWVDPEKMRLRGRVLDRHGNRGDVWNYSTKLGTDFDHPLVALRRPVDVNRYKRAWNEEIWRMMEEGLQIFATRKWMWDAETGREKDNFPLPSDINPKDLGRFNDMLDAFIGGPQGGDLDDFKALEGGFDKMANMMVDDPQYPEICGWVAARVILVKVMALMSERDGKFGANMRAALAVERSSVPKEMQDALGTMAGAGVDANFGVIMEAVQRLGFNFHGLREINTAVAMLLTDTADRGSAEHNLNRKKAAMLLNSIVQLGQEINGAKPKK